MPTDIKQDIQKILDYMKDAEESHYEEWLADGDTGGHSFGHIFESVLNVQNWFNEQK